MIDNHCRFKKNPARLIAIKHVKVFEKVKKKTKNAK